MSLKNRLFSILTVVIAGLAFSTFTLAQEGKATTPAPDKEKAERHFKGEGHEGGKHGGRGEGFGHRHDGMMRYMHELNLTDAQKTQIQSIMDANKPDQTTRDEMHTLFEAKHNGTLTTEQQARLDALKEQKKAKAKLVQEEILNVLTVEQKTLLEQKKAERQQRKEERRQKREPRQQQTEPAETTKNN